MTTAAPSTALATIQPAFTDAERLALAGYLAGYRGLTRDAYALDLRQFTAWCRARSLALFTVRRADIEGFARELEARGRARTTVTRRLSTIAGSCKYAVEEELLDHSPAAHVRRPRVDYESHAVALDRNELGTIVDTLITYGKPHTGTGTPATGKWLFPGLLPGQPITAERLSARLNAIGIPVRAARRAALTGLAAQVPAAVLADTLGINPTTAVNWAHDAGSNWNRYAAELARNRHHERGE